MSVRDRIRAVAETRREPRSVNWSSEHGAWSTTDEERQDLGAQSQLRRVEAGEATRYRPAYTRPLFEEVRTLIEENTREELHTEVAALESLLLCSAGVDNMPREKHRPGWAVPDHEEERTVRVE